MQAARKRRVAVLDEIRSHCGAEEARLDRPHAGTVQPGYGLVLEGWVLGDGRRVETVEVLAEGSPLAVARVDLPRPDLADAHPTVAHAGSSGFRAAVGLLGVPPSFELVVEGALADGERVALWTMRGRRDPLPAKAIAVRPIMIRSFARTGSTWLMRLLEHHPQVVGYRPFEYEPRLLAYWIEVLRALAEPRSRLVALRPYHQDEGWWLGQDPPPPPHPDDEFAAAALLGGDVNALADLARSRIDAFYAEFVRASGKDAIAFAEKGLGARDPTGRTTRLAYELFPEARELFLVRDPRDMLCSMLAYDERRGWAGFDRRGLGTVGLAQWIGEALVEMTRAHRDVGEASLLVRYEDLLADPPALVRQVCAHCGLDTEPQVVEELVERASVEHPAMAGHRTSGDRPAASIGRWRRDLAPELRAEVNEAFAEAIALHGYEAGP